LRLKILKKLKTASLNSEFTGSYKKVYWIIIVKCFYPGQPESPNEAQYTIHLVTIALIWSHSCINPFLYAFMREDVKSKVCS